MSFILHTNPMMGSDILNNICEVIQRARVRTRIKLNSSQFQRSCIWPESGTEKGNQNTEFVFSVGAVGNRGRFEQR